MKAAPVTYVAPGSLADAIDLVSSHGGDAKLLGGGQSLLPLLNMRLATPEVLIDVSRLSELHGKHALADGGVSLGSATVHSKIEDDQAEDYAGGLLAVVAGGIGYRAVRNKGTLGGSLAHADASAEWPVVMAALGATILAASSRGETRYPAEGFVQGFLTSAVAEDEIIVSVEVPGTLRNARSGFYKSTRKPGEFSDSIAVVVLKMAPSSDVIERASVWLGAARDVPLELTGVEAALSGHPIGEASSGDIISTVERELGDAATPEERYWRHLHGLSVRRALERAVQP